MLFSPNCKLNYFNAAFVSVYRTIVIVYSNLLIFHLVIWLHIFSPTQLPSYEQYITVFLLMQIIRAHNWLTEIYFVAKLHIFPITYTDRTVFVGRCHYGMACPQVADGGTASDMEGSCE